VRGAIDGSLGGALTVARAAGAQGRALAEAARSAFVSGLGLSLAVGAAIVLAAALAAAFALPSARSTASARSDRADRQPLHH
jgi:hypothetical protein